MPSSTRDIKRRLRSIKNTRQMTRAMELVSAAKMRRATGAVLGSRPYSTTTWQTTLELVEKTERERHPLLRRPTGTAREGMVVITGNRGLAGAFNQQLITLVRSKATAMTDIVLFGKKGATLATTHSVIAVFDKADVASSILEITPAAELIAAEFIAFRWQRVSIAYTDFVSTLRQRAVIRQLLPIERVPEGLGSVGREENGSGTSRPVLEFTFEPSPDVVLEALLPRLVEIQLYQALLESNASEHAARMVAMKNATENADEFLSDLTLSFNQARQAAITREIAEISASRAAIG